ncbi:glycosyltransferase [Bradyrhizobium arachidis]|uniref:glycosyltransferase n=1 Tax=Bradyrhizobium arachidis TaxID=858423 RepID=UPI0021618FD7|nr:glycosyltransferase [Bradyrhizobium arachidis]UVO39204.1 glycosyltransferase [Bradyrhizobium arachidis]
MRFRQLAGYLQIARPYIRRLLPAWLHHMAGHAGRCLVSRIERRVSDARIVLPALFSDMSRMSSDNGERFSVAIIAESLAAGGAERQVVNLARELALRGRRVLLLTLRSEERPELHFFKDEVAGLEQLVVRNAMPLPNATRFLIEVGGSSRFEALRQGLSWAPVDISDDILRLVAELHHAAPNVVHGFQDAAGIDAAFAALALDTPRIIISGRNVHPEHFSHGRPYMKAAYRALAEHRSVTLVNNSAAGARSYVEWLELPEGAVRVLRNGIVPGAFVLPSTEEIRTFRRKFGLLPEELLVGGVFRLQAEKQPMIWFEVAVGVHRRMPNTRFVVFGEGTMRRPLLKAVMRSGLGDRFMIPGTTNEARIAIAGFDVLLLTSSLEGTPNVVLEAGSMGVPIVATDAGGTGETMIDGQMGLLVRGDGVGKEELVTALTEAVVSVLAGKIPRSKAVAVGPNFVKARFGLERMIEETLKLYQTPST